MQALDWVVMLGTLFFIVAYGTWKTKGSKNIQAYLRGDNSSKWWTIGLSVMATQASAITFLSTPGQGFDDGMRFVQFYFGLPLAMILIAVFFIPIYYRLKVYTAYEYLESRFDVKVRVLTAILFLIQRGLAAGITIFAPAIILSEILGWGLNFTILFIGVLVIIYTVSGGTKAVAQTHKQQMAVIFIGMFIAFGLLVYYLSDHVSFGQALDVAGSAGRMNIIDLDFDLGNRYNIWSGIIGGLFLQLSYFGTDQSQVGRYLVGTSVKESRLGLMFNGLIKVPMQFFILLVGVLVFVFYEFNQAPVYFNETALEHTRNSEYGDQLTSLEDQQSVLFSEKQQAYGNWKEAINAGNGRQAESALSTVQSIHTQEKDLRQQTQTLVRQANPDIDKGEDDLDYVFISWVMKYLPIGIVGLLLAVIFSAAMSSTAAELNALASTSAVDIYKRLFKKEGTEKHYVVASKLLTILFGALAITFAMVARRFDNLIEAVNIIGSLFYGTILGIFLVAFFIKFVRSVWVVLWSAAIAESLVLFLYWQSLLEVPLINFHVEYLWLNFIGCGLVVSAAILLQLFWPITKPA